MEWNRGFSASFYASFINPDTWADSERFEITGGSVQKNDNNLLESASINCTDFQSFSEMWVRIWMNASQDGSSAHEPIFTGLAINPARSFAGTNETNTLTCYSVLKPADDILLPRGWYINKGANVRETVNELLRPTKAPIIFDAEPSWITDTIIAEDGETNLSMLQTIVSIINWRMNIDGYGRIHFSPAVSKESPIIVSKFDATDNDIVGLNVNVENDWFSSPNVFRAISDDLTAIARDDDPNSPYSTISRGREIWMEESDVVLDSTETLSKYANRRLKEEQYMTFKASYSRRFNPDIYIGDIVQIHYPTIGLSGLFTITSQTIDISAGAPTSEEAYMVG